MNDVALFAALVAVAVVSAFVVAGLVWHFARLVPTGFSFLY
jgi:hypothetical protein